MPNVALSPKPVSNDVHTYRRIRRSIGLLGVGLPIVLVVLSLVSFFKTNIQPSISHYYYTNLRDIFTGTLCAVGLFLIRYKGHSNKSFWRNDNILTNIAGIMAFGVVLVPTNPTLAEEKIYTIIPSTAEWLGWLHYGFAAALFTIFSFLAINVFTIGQKQDADIPVSVFNENKIYTICGVSIIAFIIMVPISAKLDLFPSSTLVFEGLSLFAFGFAWLIKGRALGDTGKIGEKLYRERNTKAGNSTSAISSSGSVKGVVKDVVKD